MYPNHCSFLDSTKYTRVSVIQLAFSWHSDQLFQLDQLFQVEVDPRHLLQSFWICLNIFSVFFFGRQLILKYFLISKTRFRIYIYVAMGSLEIFSFAALDIIFEFKDSLLAFSVCSLYSCLYLCTDGLMRIYFENEVHNIVLLLMLLPRLFCTVFASIM